MRKLIQIENEAGDRLYPEIHGDSIPNDAVTTEKVKDDSVTEPKLSTELGRKITGSKTVTDTLLRAFTEAKGDPYYLQDAFVRANLIPIPFEDEEVKRILVENYDTDGDGELSYDEAQKAIKNYSSGAYTGVFYESAFYNNTKLRSFNEFRFFDSVKEVGSPSYNEVPLFQGCSNLESIELPENVEDIEGYAFSDCTKLKIKGKKLPNRIETIRSNAFKNCQSLELDELPSGLTSIEENVFEDCSSLALTELPEGIEMLYYGCFLGTKVSFSKLPDSLTVIKGHALNGTQVSFTEFPDSLTGIGQNGCFSCLNLTKLTFPEGLTSIGQMAFYNCENLKELTMKGSTPPSLGTLVFAGSTKLTAIYVPDDAVETYKTATEWSTYASIIKPVSEKPAS